MVNARKNKLNIETSLVSIVSFAELVAFMRSKTTPQYRQAAFERVMALEKYKREGDVLYMTGAEYNETEKQTAEKLSKEGYYVVFSGKGQIKKIRELEGNMDKRKNDVYIYDRKTYQQSKVDFKTSGDPSVKTIKEHIISGSGQAPVIVLDITGKTSVENIVKGFRQGWVESTKKIILSYRGQWYELDHDKVFSKWIKKNLK
jgi:hypothetical protein